MNTPFILSAVILLVPGGAFGFGLLGGLSGLTNAVPFVGQGLLNRDGSNIMISMKDGPLAQLNKLEDGSDPGEVASLLQGVAETSQAPVLTLLNSLGVKSESYWITNQIFVKDAKPTVINALMAIPGVKSIMEEMIIPLPPIFDMALGTQPNGTEWNVKLMDVEKVWDETTGEGIVVAGIDTGVRHTHSALADNFVGLDDYGWHDPILYTTEPNDLHGHGTHTMGTIAGKNGIGVAPGAKWMACRACLAQGCMQHALLACGQFVLCPSNPNSGKKKCKGRPHVVNNSWGTNGGQNWYDLVIRAWLKAGIVPFFANGNAGPKCETGGSPGDHDHVIAVGSTDNKDRLSKYSSRGPKVKYEMITDGAEGNKPENQGLFGDFFGDARKKVPSDTIKPDICAPGEKVNSAFIITDNSYKFMSGTSMASPAATGVAALLLSKYPKMSLKDLKDYMYSTTEKNLNLTPGDAKQCGSVPENQYPNLMCGYGRVNAWQAYKKMKKMMKKKKKKDKDAKDEDGDKEDEKKKKKARKSKGAGGRGRGKTEKSEIRDIFTAI